MINKYWIAGRRPVGRVALGAGVAVVAFAAASYTASAQEVLNVYNWSDYIAEDTIANFEEQTGIKVNYDVYDSNSVVEAKLLAGNSGYDIVVPTAVPYLARQIEAGVYMPLDRSKIPNWDKQDPDLLGPVGERADPGNEHAAIYMWYTFTKKGYEGEAHSSAAAAGVPVAHSQCLPLPCRHPQGRRVLHAERPLPAQDAREGRGQVHAE